MTSQARPNARAEASRRNGARSRGPVTAAGRASSARGALKHGLRARAAVLLDDEDAAAFQEFATALRAELQPEGALQTDLAARIALAAWRAGARTGSRPPFSPATSTPPPAGQRRALVPR